MLIVNERARAPHLNMSQCGSLKVSEKDAKITDSERLFSTASRVSDEKRKRWLLLVTV